MKKAGEFLAMLLRRWDSKTPKRARITQVVVGVIGAAAWVALAVPTLGLSMWITIPAGIIASGSTAYQQLRTNEDKKIIKESREILKSVDK